MIDTQWYSLSPTLFTVLFGVVLLMLTALFSVITLNRVQWSRRMVFLEALRLLLVAMVAFTIVQPEWVQQFLPTEEPVLAVLWDESKSMETQDVVKDDDPRATPVTRKEWVEPFLNDSIWETYANRVKIVKKPFSSDLKDSTTATDLNNALLDVVQKHENLRGVVVFSDGDWNIGKSPTDDASSRLRMQNVPAFMVGVGSENSLPDIEVAALDAPTFGVVRKPTRIPFTIKSTISQPVNIIASLSSSDGDEMTANFEIEANGKLEDAFVWKPKKTGEYTLKLTVPRHDQEWVESNNSLSVPISIRKESLRVLVVESFPRWEYRYLRNALSRDPGVDVSCLLFHPGLPKRGGGKDYIDKFPSSQEALSKYDVIFLGDVGVGDGQLTVENCEDIKGLVESQASGLILMPGFRGRQFSLMTTPLSDLFPVQLDEAQFRGWGSQVPGRFQLTENGSASLLTKLADSPEANSAVWRGLPGFQWYAPVRRAKAGSTVLAVHSTDSNDLGRIPLLVTKTFGAGKVLFMGTDAAWRWREGVEDRYHYRFWGQVARWMSYQRNMAGGDRMRLFYSPDRPKVGDTLNLNSNVIGVSGDPLQSGDVTVQIIAPSGNTQKVKLVPPTGGGEWGLFAGVFTPQEKGEHEVRLTCRETGGLLETTITVQGSEREKIGKPANLEVMQEIAQITRGKMVMTSRIEEIFKAIDQIPEPEARIRRIRLWSHPAWAMAIIGLLGVFWIGRKWAGAI